MSATEAFILSRIDGSSTLEELAEVVAMSMADTRRAVEHLAELGAVKVDGPRGKTLRPTRAPGKVNKSLRPAVRAKTIPAPKSKRPAPKSEPPCELELDLQQRIRDLDARLPTQSDHELLGVSADAGAREIKRAYYALAATYHPDRFFGKKLGPLRATVDRIFTHMTNAHERLLVAAKRSGRRTIAPKASTQAPPPRVSERPKQKRRSMPAPSSKRAPKARSAPPQISLEAYTLASEQAYRRIGTEKAKVAAKARAQIFLDVARSAQERGDPATAAQHYRLALQLFDDPAIAVACKEMEVAAANFAHDTASKQAREAEKASDWSNAARHWKVAHDARPGPVVAERLAHALVRSGGDLRRAVSLAQDALLEEPDRLDIRLTLAEALLAAGLVKRARAEVDRALERAPRDSRPKDLLARIKRSL